MKDGDLNIIRYNNIVVTKVYVGIKIKVYVNSYEVKYEISKIVKSIAGAVNTL